MRLFFAFVLFTLLSTGLFAADRDWTYANINIDRMGYERLDQLKAMEGLEWWVELDETLFVYINRDALSQIAKERTVTVHDIEPNHDQLAFANLFHDDLLNHAEIIAAGGRFAVIRWFGAQERAERARAPRDHKHDHLAVYGHDHGGGITPLKPNTILACQQVNLGPPARIAKKTSVTELINQIHPGRWFYYIYQLNCFNRFSGGDDIHNARDWVVEQYADLPDLDVQIQEFTFRNITAYNIIATLPGTESSDDFYIVGAHYDAISPNPTVAAPGAEDNGSGSAGVMELARLFHNNRPRDTVHFILYSGEEQGLFGSDYHARLLQEAEIDGNMRGMLNMDMIAYTADDRLNILLEGHRDDDALIQEMAANATTYTVLEPVISYSPSGSDHVPYIQRGMPAILIIESDWFRYPSYHQVDDFTYNFTHVQGGEVLKLVAATLGQWAGAVE